MLRNSFHRRGVSFIHRAIFILVHLMGKCLPNIDDCTRKINCISGSLFKTPGIFNQGRQITKIEIDFESKSRECVKSKELR